MKKALFSVSFLLLLVLTLVSCGSNNSPADTTTTGPTGTSTNSGTQTTGSTNKQDEGHTHSYVDHQAVEATWDEEGSIHYFTCSGCDKLFDENKTEITAQQIIVSAKKLNYEFDNFEWADDNLSAKAVYKNKTNSNDIIKLDAAVSNTKEDPTCSANGMVTYVAVHGGNQATKSLQLAKSPHDYEFKGMQWSNDNQSAVAYYVCKGNPSHTKIEQTSIQSSIQQASCLEAGVRTIKASFDDDYEEIKIRIEATGHDFDDRVIDPTCTEKGYTEHVCNTCDYSYIDSYTDALGHDWNHEQDCTHGSECSRCDATLDPLNHNYELTETKNATCTEPKTYVYDCERCQDHKEVTEGVAKGHDIEGVAGVAVLVDGETCKYVLQYQCKNCTEKVDGEYIFKHDYKASIKEEATCQHGGVKTLTCSKCNGAYDVDTDTDPDAHDWELGEVSGGVRTDHCQNDGCTATREVKVFTGTTTDAIPASELANSKVEVNGANLALDKSLVNELTGKDITLSVNEANKSDLNLTDDQKQQIGDSKVYDFGMTSGSDKVDFNNNYVTITLPYTLSANEDVDNIAIWFINDEGEVESIEATYNNGFVTFKTNHFSFYTITRLTPAERCALYGHQYDEKHVEGSCTADSYDLYICKRCHDSKIENLVAAPGHNYQMDDEESCEATCTTNGITVYVCTECNDTYSNTTLATGHNHQKDNDQHVDATCTANGKDVYVCSKCNDSYEVAIPMIAHTYTTKTTLATCEAFGYDEHECSMCHDTYKDNYTTPVAHTIDWVWASDYSTATFKLECSSVASHSVEQAATVKQLSMTATCQQDGETVYVATAKVGDLTYTDSKIVKVDKLEHTKNDTWLSDGDHHWHECTMCHEKLDVTDHDWNGDNVCDTCGAKTCDHKPTIRKFFNMADYYDDCCGLFIDYYTCECGKVVQADPYSSDSPMVSLCHIDERSMKEEELPDGSMSQIIDCPDCGLHVESIYNPNDYSGEMVIFYNGENLFNIYVPGMTRDNDIDLEEHGCCGGHINYYARTTEDKTPYSVTNLTIDCQGYNRTSQGTQTVIDGVQHMIYEFTCSECGLVCIRDTYQIKTACVDETHRIIKITKGNEVIFSCDEVQQQQHHTLTYEILNKNKEDLHCGSGTTIGAIVTCSVCGIHRLQGIYSHMVNGSTNIEYKKELDLSPFGIDAKIYYAECEVCHEILINEYNSFKEVMSMMSTITKQETDSKGITHYITEATIINSPIKVVMDSYQEPIDQCRYIQYRLITVYNGSTVLLQYTNSYNSSHHDYESTYEFTTIVPNCENGIRVTRVCKICGDKYYYTTNSHTTGDSKELDLTEDGVPVIVTYSECLCGKEGYVEIRETEDKEHYVERQYKESSYRDSKGIVHTVNTTTYLTLNVTITRDRYETAGSKLCSKIQYTKYTIKKNNKIIFNKTVSSEYTDHDYEISYKFLTEDHDCTKGVIVTRTCTVCGDSHEEEMYGHHTELVERIDLSEYSKCGGYIEVYECPCGKEHHINTRYNCEFGHETCEMTATDYIDDLYHEAYYQTCGVDGCGFVIRREVYFKQSDTCKKIGVENIKIGYDKTTGKFIKEIEDENGYQYLHDFNDTTKETREGEYRVITATRTCKHCGYQEETIEYYDSKSLVRRIEERYNPENKERTREEAIYKYFPAIDEYRVVERIYNNNSRTTYDYDFSNCKVIETYYSDGQEKPHEYYNHNYVRSNVSCTQPGGGICRNCGQPEDKVTEALGHDWVFSEEDQHYHCSRCGLESDTNTDGDIVLEQIYGYYDSFIVGYYDRNNHGFNCYIELDYPDTDNDKIIDEKEITISLNKYGARTISISLSELYEYIENNNINFPDGTKINMVFVSEAQNDYRISYN
ncbi:MAG: hypothetical protein IKP77_07535 [Acholeplasmatales bacterium]|nr:hypothetical protein [Acholeplasmatales bacterium]